jgi:hypothetical protein
MPSTAGTSRALETPVAEDTLIKKKIKFSSYIRKFRSGAVAKSYMRKGFLIYEEMHKYFSIYEEAVSHI